MAISDHMSDPAVQEIAYSKEYDVIGISTLSRLNPPRNDG